MKKYIFLLSMSFLMGAGAHAEETGLYGKFLSGANVLQDTSTDGNKTRYEIGYIVSGALGLNTCYGVGLEVEYAYRRNDIKKMHFVSEGYSKHGHFQTSSYMGNLFWNVPLCACDIQPFIGTGLGYDFQQMRSGNDRIKFSQKWNHFAWQVMTGLTCPILCNMEASLEYRFHQGGSHFNNHSVGVGLTYMFSVFNN